MGTIGLQEEGAKSRVCAEPEKGLWGLKGLGGILGLGSWGQGAQEATSLELATANHQKLLSFLAAQGNTCGGGGAAGGDLRGQGGLEKHRVLSPCPKAKR